MYVICVQPHTGATFLSGDRGMSRYTVSLDCDLSTRFSVVRIDGGSAASICHQGTCDGPDVAILIGQYYVSSSRLHRFIERQNYVLSGSGVATLWG